jgi:hypothetical protein
MTREFSSSVSLKLPLSLGAVMFALAACAGTAESLVVRDVENLVIKDFTSSDPAACTTADVDLTNAEARQFFQRAIQISYRQLQDDYPLAPCRLEGTLTYRGQLCEWTISAAGTGSIVCRKRTWHLACDDCQDLLVR